MPRASSLFFAPMGFCASGVLRRFRLLQAKLQDHDLADFELLDLARHGLWKDLNEAYVARNLVVGELAAAKFAHFHIAELTPA